MPPTTNYPTAPEAIGTIGSPSVAHLAIRDWHSQDQPREKFTDHGAAALSDAELLAILIGSGPVGQSAVDVARRVLTLADNDLSRLASLDWRQLCQVKGIGQARAVTLAAALELGRRHNAMSPAELPVVQSPRQAYNLARPAMMGLRSEVFMVFLLNTASRLIRQVCIGKGGLDGVIADPRLIFRQALLEGAASVILLHNHPSGTLRPSQADDNLTRILAKAGAFLQIPVRDHLIVTDGGYYSYADEGRLP